MSNSIEPYETSRNLSVYCTTPGRRQSKTLLTIDERGSKIARNSVFDRKQFLTIFDLRLSIVLAFSIAAYQVCVLEMM